MVDEKAVQHRGTENFLYSVFVVFLCLCGEIILPWPWT
jgi:hypothetical protein